MSETTNIAWCDSTGNPWIGCTKVSPGCKHCYAAELDANKFSRTMGGATKDNPISHWGKGAPRVRTKAFWKDALKWNAEHEHNALVNRRHGHPINKPERPRIFPSLCDWLDDEVPIQWLADFLKLIHDTPNLDWLLLTKRPDNWKTRIESAMLHLAQTSNAVHKCKDGTKDCGCFSINDAYSSAWRWVRENSTPSNAWIGVSVEDQKRADERIPQLLQIPAKVRFLSVEPLLSSVDLSHIKPVNPNAPCVTNSLTGETFWPANDSDDGPKVDWVIVGGESGKDRRDCGVDAIADVANQCVAAGVPCFVKQDCAFKPGQQGRIPDETWALKQFPKAI